MECVYLDNAATTKPFSESLDSFVRAERDSFANPSSSHALGKESRRFIESKRRMIAEILGIDAGYYNVVFISNATQGNEMMLQSLLKRPYGNALIGAAEHNSISENGAILKCFGRKVHRISCPKGFADADSMIRKLDEDDRIRLVSIMQTNNVTGSISDVYSLAESAKRLRPETVFHSDCVQSLNLGIIDFHQARKSGIDAMTFSSHKSYAPKGTGLLVIRKGLLPSLSVGGGQEGGIRGGTEAVGLISAYAAALDKLFSIKSEYNARSQRLCKMFLDSIRDIPSYKVLRDGCGEYSSGIVALCSRKLPSEVLQRILSDKGIMVSVTSACSSNAMKGSDNKLALMGYDPAIAKNTIRLSFGISNTEDDIRRTVSALADIDKEY